MKLDLPNAEHWESLNDQVKISLGIASPLQVRVYKDLSSAVLEVAQGTAQFLSHKKSLGFIRGQTPAFDFLLPHFYKEAFQIKQTSYVHLTNPSEWVEGLHRDTGFVIFAEDHPITGEVYGFCDELDRLLNEKRIHSLRISHARFLKNQNEFLEVRPYSVRLCSWAADLTIAVCGERYRSPVMVAHRQSWDAAAILTELQKLQADSPAGTMEMAQNIMNFEKRMSATPSVQPWFVGSTPRLWDRAVLNFTDVSGEALAQQLAKKLSLLPWDSHLIETTNMCRWATTRLYQSWWEPLPSNETLRGLVIFDAAILDRKDFESLLLSSYEEIKALQTW